MFCEKCGTEIPDNAKFCEKCGALVEPELQEHKEEVSHKKWILGGIIGGIAVVAVVVVLLFATGVLGGKEETVQTSNGMQSGIGESETAQQQADTPVETVAEEPTATPMITPNPTIDSESAAESAVTDGIDTFESNVEIPDVSMEYLQSVAATSELSERNMIHSAERICDGKLKNAWVEGVSGQGIGEEVTFVFDNSYSFSGMKINAGYQKSKELYYKNSRPKKMKITFSDGSSITVKLKDYYGVQNINFDNRVVADQVTVTIESVYKGNKYKDMVISELEWY